MRARHGGAPELTGNPQGIARGDGEAEIVVAITVTVAVAREMAVQLAVAVVTLGPGGGARPLRMTPSQPPRRSMSRAPLSPGWSEVSTWIRPPSR